MTDTTNAPHSKGLDTTAEKLRGEGYRVRFTKDGNKLVAWDASAAGDPAYNRWLEQADFPKLQPGVAGQAVILLMPKFLSPANPLNQPNVSQI